MTKVFCNIADGQVDPLFEVFDSGDFILSSYHDIEESDTQMQVYLADPAQAGEAARRLKDALALVGSNAQVETSEVPDEDWKLSYRRHFKIEPIGHRLVTVPTWELEGFKASGEFSDRIPLVLDPGMAFGTGKHETTRACLEYIDELAIKCTSSRQKARELSGGNQQKVCLAKAFALEPGFLFVSEPTRGIDVGAKALVLDALRRFNRESGVTVVMISSELEELRQTADRIAIVSGGRIAGILPASESSEAFGALMVSQVI